MASTLNLPPSQVKVAKVTPAQGTTGRRRQGVGSYKVEYELGFTDTSTADTVVQAVTENAQQFLNNLVQALATAFPARSVTAENPSAQAVKHPVCPADPSGCFVDVCKGVSCPSQTAAKCCPVGCRHEFRLLNGNRAACTPKCDSWVIPCLLIDPCSTAKCPARPDAVCAESWCGGCHAEFLDPNTGIAVSCDVTPAPVPSAGPAGAFRGPIQPLGNQEEEHDLLIVGLVVGGVVLVVFACGGYVCYSTRKMKNSHKRAQLQQVELNEIKASRPPLPRQVSEDEPSVLKLSASREDGEPEEEGGVYPVEGRLTRGPAPPAEVVPEEPQPGTPRYQTSGGLQGELSFERRELSEIALRDLTDSEEATPTKL